MSRTAVTTSRSKAVEPPKEDRPSTDEVAIRSEWPAYLESGPASDRFMNDVADLPVQEREP